MAEHIWTVLCERHLVDPANKVISLLDVMESISEDGLEQRLEYALSLGKKGVLINVPSQLVSWWFRSDPKEEALQIRFVLQNPAGISVLEQVATITWGEHASVPARIYLSLGQFPVTMFGLHWFIVEQLKTTKSGKARWVAVTKIPLSVEKVIGASSVPEPPS
jgi:hypothetical protein